MLSLEERRLLFVYCWDHAVAYCRDCDLHCELTVLGADLSRNRTHLCPRCRVDLSASAQAHLSTCTLLRIQAEEARERARVTRQQSRELQKESRQARDRAEVLSAEAESLRDEAERLRQQRPGHGK
jgi:hypothetical protein